MTAGAETTDMPRRLTGRTVLIFGGASGIGAAIARRCAAEGGRIACADFDESGAHVLAAELGDAGLGIGCDVTDGEAVRDAVAATVERFGQLDGMVFNAAPPSQEGSVVELDAARWRFELDVGLTGAFLASKHAIPAMTAGGSIVFVASQFAHVAVAGFPVYCAMKAGLVHLAKAMAVDHASDGIRVNSLSPGAVATERLLSRHADYAAADAALGPAHVLGRIGQPDEIAAAAAFLLSDDASFMTGADMLVDGGYATR